MHPDREGREFMEIVELARLTLRVGSGLVLHQELQSIGCTLGQEIFRGSQGEIRNTVFILYGIYVFMPTMGHQGDIRASQARAFETHLSRG
jgi:hypothetical protein